MTGAEPAADHPPRAKCPIFAIFTPICAKILLNSPDRINNSPLLMNNNICERLALFLLVQK
jgi:hypothetical protein